MSEVVAENLDPEYFKTAAAIRDAASAFVETMDEEGRREKFYWMHSHKARADIYLRGDVAFMFTLLDEINPEVKHVEIESPRAVASIDSEPAGTRLDACVTYSDGHVQWREYKRHKDVADNREAYSAQIAAQKAAADRPGVRHVLLTERQLKGRLDECLNALPLLGWRNRVRGLSSAKQSNLLDTHFERVDTSALWEILALPDIDVALMLAAIAERLMNGTLRADTAKPLTRSTLVVRGTCEAMKRSEDV